MNELRKYATSDIIYFTVYDPTTGQIAAPTFATGDIKYSIDGVDGGNTTNLPVADKSGWKLTLTTGELTGKVIKIEIIDQTATKVWLDCSIVIETYGNASAQHPNIGKVLNDLAAADIRTAVGLASANTDTQLSAIAALVAASAIRSAVGLTSANIDTQLAAIAAYIDTEVAAIKAKTDNLPATPAAVGDIPTTAQITAAIEALATYKKMLAANIGSITNNNDGTFTYKDEAGLSIFTFTILNNTRTRIDA